MFTYDRSAAGAKEKITIKNCNIEIAVNGEAKTVTELNFILNEYGDCTGDKATQYQCKIPVGKKLSAGDTVTVTFKSKNGDFSGEGESTAKIDTLTVSLIDNAEAANWYNELVATSLEYQPLFNKENSSNNGDPVTPPAGAERPSETITFSVTENSTNAENTVLMFKYDRSAAGAKEAVTIDNCGIVVEINGVSVKTVDKLEFELDEYGAYFDGDKSENTRKEYKLKVSLGKQVKKDDNVVVYYNKGIGTITGEGKDAEAVKTLVVALIDTDEAVKYYKEIANKEFQSLSF